jgi:hypothetical protein
VTENSQPILAHANASNAELHLRDPIVGGWGQPRLEKHSARRSRAVTVNVMRAQSREGGSGVKH